MTESTLLRQGWHCPLCGHLLLRPVNRRLKYCRWCGIRWGDDLIEGTPCNHDPFEPERIPLPMACPALVYLSRPMKVVATAGATLLLYDKNGDQQIEQWVGDPPHFFDHDTLTLYIHEGIGEAYAKDF